jgi:hypothetical protein
MNTSSSAYIVMPGPPITNVVCCNRSPSHITTDSQSAKSVSVSGAHLGPATNFTSALRFSSDSCGFVIFVAATLTRGRVCNLLYNCFWALPEQSLLGGSPAELTALFYFPSARGYNVSCPVSLHNIQSTPICSPAVHKDYSVGVLPEVMGLERGSLSLVSTIEELLEGKSRGSGLENQEYGRRDPSRWPRGTI